MFPNDCFLTRGKTIAKTKKPIILSTGASSLNEIKNSVNFLKKNGVKDDSIAILHCVLSYPTKDVDANLQFIDLLKKKFPRKSFTNQLTLAKNHLMKSMKYACLL